MTKKRVGDIFQDFEGGPELIVIPSGAFLMGSNGSLPREAPQHRVVISHPIAVGLYPVTFEEWDLCYKDDGTSYCPPESPMNPSFPDGTWERGRRPVINVDWNDAREFIDWLRRKTGKNYRLPSEAEWEYFARAGTSTEYTYGDKLKDNSYACCKDCSDPSPINTINVGSFEPNNFGIYDVHGNVWEWVEDSRNNDTYSGAPTDGAAWIDQQQAFRMLRGGSWRDESQELRSAYRKWSTNGYRFNGGTLGFRVVRDLTPDELGITLTHVKRHLLPVDLDSVFETDLRSLQAGILRPIKASFFAAITGHFNNLEIITSALHEYSQFVTSAEEIERKRKIHKTSEIDIYRTIHLSSNAYRKMGFEQGEFSNEFWNGMSSSQLKMRDPKKEEFPHVSDREIPDVLFLIWANTSENLRASLNDLKNWAGTRCQLTCMEQGHRRTNEFGKALGPLGFVDGISQPLFVQNEAKETINSAIWDPYCEPGLVIVDDPNCADNGIGSYLVYRKYHVDSDKFDSEVERIRSELKIMRTEEDVQAMFVGRYRDGTPIARYSAPTPDGDMNDFNFKNDPTGARCPFHSHVRKMNPRGAHLGRDEKQVRIVRRGVPFWKDQDWIDCESISRGVSYNSEGLIFLCFQASIQNQFEFLQIAWANDGTFEFGQFPNVDTLIGVPGKTYLDDPASDYYVAQKKTMKWAHSWGQPQLGFLESDTDSFANVVGGEYFFTPSRKWLMSL